MELKAHHTDIRNAYTDNITDYKDTIPHVFHHNAFIILSNGTDAKVGTVTSPFKFFLDWKRITEEEEGIVSLDTVIKGTCSKQNLMDIFLVRVERNTLRRMRAGEDADYLVML
jgi:type I restriction enzyme R subunit